MIKKFLNFDAWTKMVVVLLFLGLAMGPRYSAMNLTSRLESDGPEEEPQPDSPAPAFPELAHARGH